VTQEPEPDVVLRFGHDPNAAREARRALEALFEEDDDPIAEAVTLSASELVTNVVLHTEGGGELRAWDPKPDVPLRLEVEDPDPSLPAPRDVPADDERGGRGLRIVTVLADAWGTMRTAAGKVVWAEFDRVKRRQQQR